MSETMNNVNDATAFTQSPRIMNYDQFFHFVMVLMD